MAVRNHTLAAVVADELERGQQKGEEAGGNAAHREHESQPAEVGVGTLVGDAAEGREHQQDGDGSGAEDREAGKEESAGVWLHRGSVPNQLVSGRRRASHKR
jgi:hypothetical protein